jgi:hypothetical protein
MRCSREKEQHMCVSSYASGAIFSEIILKSLLVLVRVSAYTTFAVNALMVITIVNLFARYSHVIALLILITRRYMYCCFFAFKKRCARLVYLYTYAFTKKNIALKYKRIESGEKVRLTIRSIAHFSDLLTY